MPYFRKIEVLGPHLTHAPIISSRLCNFTVAGLNQKTSKLPHRVNIGLWAFTFRHLYGKNRVDLEWFVHPRSLSSTDI